MLHNLTRKKDVRSFSICPENPTGGEGYGRHGRCGRGKCFLCGALLFLNFDLKGEIVL